MPDSHAAGEGAITIYGLADPRDMVIRYVGQTQDIHRRLIAHVSSARTRDISRRTQKDLWILGMLGSGVSPTIILLERATDLTCGQVEENWRKILGTLTPLLNIGPSAKLRRQDHRDMRARQRARWANDASQI
jgi:hypothetical protein